MSNDAEAYRLLIADVHELAAMTRRASERLAIRHGQSIARWQILAVVAQEGALAVPVIASRLGLARQSVQRVVHELVRDGQLARRPNPHHRTSPLMALTDGGRDVLRQLEADAEDGRGLRLTASGLERRELLDARRTVRSLLAVLRTHEA